jgi:hypothetical protein
MRPSAGSPVLASAACPRCAVGIQARQEFWDGEPAFYSAALLAPFVLVALVGLYLSRVGSKYQ